MATDPLNGLFSDLLPQPNTWLDGLIRDQVRKSRRLPPPRVASGCVLADMGEFLVLAMEQLTRFVEIFVNGSHVGIYTRVKVREMEQEHGFSELDEFEYLDDIHHRLKSAYTPQVRVSSDSVDRYIEQLINQTAHGVHKSWSKRPHPPTRRIVSDFDPYERPHQSPMDRDHFQGETSYAQSSGSRNSELDEAESGAYPSPNHADEMQAYIEDWYSKLDKRGTGEYQCPHRENCRKGGVEAGYIRTFTRNSDFK